MFLTRGGGVTTIGTVSRAATGVKTVKALFRDRSNGQATGVLGPISSIARRPRLIAEILCMRG